MRGIIEIYTLAGLQPYASLDGVCAAFFSFLFLSMFNVQLAHRLYCTQAHSYAVSWNTYYLNQNSIKSFPVSVSALYGPSCISVISNQ